MTRNKKILSFEQQKRNVLSRKDNSKKGSIDRGVKEIVEMINSLDDFYTTSSCSGRIMLIERKSCKKNEAEWLFSSHDAVAIDELLEALKHIPEKPVWFKQENLILHVCARNFECAKRLLNIARDSGFKRSGIMSANKKFMIEIESADNINALIAKDGRLLVGKEYLAALLNEANQKMKINNERIRKLFSMIKYKLNKKLNN